MSNNDWMIYSTCPSMSRLGFGINTDWLVCAKYHQILVWNLVQLIISWNVWMTLESIRTMRMSSAGLILTDRMPSIVTDWLIRGGSSSYVSLSAAKLLLLLILLLLGPLLVGLFTWFMVWHTFILVLAAKWGRNAAWQIKWGGITRT